MSLMFEPQIQALTTRVPAREVMNGEPIVQLECEPKTITDAAGDNL